MELQHVITDFDAHCRRKGLSPLTLRAYGRDLQDFKGWLHQSDLTDVFSRDTVSGWVGNMRSRKLAPASIKRRLACLKVMFAWLEDEERLGLNPFHKLKLSIRLPRRLPRDLSRNELQILLSAADIAAQQQTKIAVHTLHLSLEVLFSTGVRISELCTIRMQDIDVFSGAIHIKGKGNRERRVYIIEPTTLSLVRNYIKKRATHNADTDALFITGQGTPITPDYIRRRLHKLVEGTTICRRVTPHMLRHSAATQLIECGADIRYVQKLLGHSSISTTEIYTHVTDISLRAALSQANPRRRLDKVG
ncbi:MAG: integrase [Rhodospirillaceae bacterium]|nr:MAG: integrase [Rhodospirillaceae bacterium]